MSQDDVVEEARRVMTGSVVWIRYAERDDGARHVITQVLCEDGTVSNESRIVGSDESPVDVFALELARGRRRNGGRRWSDP